MFVDYLRLTYLIPREMKDGAAAPVGLTHAEETLMRHMAGETKIDGCHLLKVHDYPEGRRLIMEFGGSVCPVDVDDFFRKFRAYKHWTVGRLDLAENVEHLSRDQVRPGRSKSYQDWYEVDQVGDTHTRTWTGCGIGERGKAGTYFRCYDARKHKDGRAAKVARFGTYDFWRLEYELSREFFRRNGYQTLGDLDTETLYKFWRSETYKKGVWIEGTSEYESVNVRDELEVSEEMSQESRLSTICLMVAKLDRERLEKLARIVKETLAEKAESGEKVSNK